MLIFISIQIWETYLNVRVHFKHYAVMIKMYHGNNP